MSHTYCVARQFGGKVHAHSERVLGSSRVWVVGRGINDTLETELVKLVTIRAASFEFCQECQNCVLYSRHKQRMDILTLARDKRST